MLEIGFPGLKELLEPEQLRGILAGHQIDFSFCDDIADPIGGQKIFCTQLVCWHGNWSGEEAGSTGEPGPDRRYLAAHSHERKI
jgi:hypothetical protein